MLIVNAIKPTLYFAINCVVNKLFALSEPNIKTCTHDDKSVAIFFYDITLCYAQRPGHNSPHWHCVTKTTTATATTVVEWFNVSKCYAKRVRVWLPQPRT